MSEWISVKDRLPEVDEEHMSVGVLVAQKNCPTPLLVNYVYNLNKYTNGEIDENRPGFVDLYCGEDYWDEYEVLDVTHWMVIPELPREED